MLNIHIYKAYSPFLSGKKITENLVILSVIFNSPKDKESH